MEAIVDTSSRPLLQIIVGEEPSLDCFTQIFQRFELELHRHRSVCVLVSGQQTRRIELSHVKKIAEFGEVHHDMLEAYVRALAFVVPSAMVRGALKIAFQLKAPPHPVRICKTETEARAYIDPYLVNLAS